MLEQVNAIKTIAGAEKDQLKGALKLGVIYTIGPFLLPHLIPLLNREAPELTLIIEENFTLNLAGQLKRGELDMIIISTPFEQTGTTLEILYKEPFTVMLPKNHWLSDKKQIKANDLIEETLLLLKSGNCFRDQVMDVCPACKSDIFSKDKIQQTLEGSSIETIKQMVATGFRRYRTAVDPRYGSTTGLTGWLNTGRSQNPYPNGMLPWPGAVPTRKNNWHSLSA